MATILSRLRLRRNRFLVVAILPLLVTILFLSAYALYMRDGTVVYWLTMLTDYTAFGLAPLITGVGLAILFLVVFWAFQVALERAVAARPQLAKSYALVTASVLLLGLLCSCGPFLLFHDAFASTHVDSLQQGPHIYHLAYKPTMGWSFVFVVYECDSTGMLCHARSKTCAVHGGDSAAPIRPDARLRIDAATDSVFAQVTGHTTFACMSTESFPS